MSITEASKLGKNTREVKLLSKVALMGSAVELSFKLQLATAVRLMLGPGIISIFARSSKPRTLHQA